MSSVRLVRVVERRLDCAVKAEMWACVCDTVVDNETGLSLFEADGAE